MEHPNKDTLIEFASGSLSVSRHASIEDHIHSCSECKQVVHAWQAISGFLSSGPALDVSPNFVARVMEDVNPQEHATRRSVAELFKEWLYPALEVACTVALVSYYVPMSPRIDVQMVLIAGLEGDVSSYDDIPAILGIDEEML